MKHLRFAKHDRSAGRLGLGAALAALCMLAPGTAAAGTPMPNHRQMEALYVIDHSGRNPKSDAQLAAYSLAFQRVLGGCTISVDNLTDKALQLADQASSVGGRYVSSLSMLQAIARRVAWRVPRSCAYIFNLAEARQENGDQ